MTTLIALTRMMESYNHAVAPDERMPSVAEIYRGMSLRFASSALERRCRLLRSGRVRAILEPCRNRREPGFRSEERRLFGRRLTPINAKRPAVHPGGPFMSRQVVPALKPTRRAR